ncbi:MAG: hypothetical protein K8R59_15355 [Thermoanaerobaculales bacterium]|nr:hypothetical protein [Thermoanaerobaculales bacterium]
MRTTVIIPDELVEEVGRLAAGEPLSRFVRESVAERVARLKREQLLRDMEAGYRAEARDPSLDSEWENLEVDGLP